MRREVLENSRAPSGRLGFLLPTCRGNLRTPSAGKGNRLSNRKSTSHTPSANHTIKTRSLRSLVTAPCRLLAIAAGASAGGASPRSLAAPTADASRPPSALSGRRPLLHYGSFQPPPLRSRLHIFFRHPHQSPREREVFRSRRSLPLARLKPAWLSLLICLLAPLRLVGVALSRGPPPRLSGLRPLRPLTRSPRSCALMGAAPFGGDSRLAAARAPLRSARRFAPRLRGSSALAGLLRCSCPSPPQGRQPSPASDIFNLYMGAAYGLAACVRYAHSLNKSKYL